MGSLTEEIKQLRGFKPKLLSELFKAYNVRCEPMEDSIFVEDGAEARRVIKKLKRLRDNPQRK